MTHNSLNLQDEILALKKEKDVVILAHNYQIPQVQDVADFVGDSLGLARQAAKTQHKTILFCGVHFMAETAAIISPEKKVLIPDLEAGCSLSDSITVNDLKNWKKQHPNAIAVGYVNTTAEIKAELDYCCTSSNAVNVVKAIPEDKEILFLPDMFLGSFVSKMTGRKNMYIWAGECHVHAGITPEDVTQKLDSMKNAEFVIHPECSCTTPMMYDVAAGNYKGRQVQILSTEGMMNHVSKSQSNQFVVATETGILYRMRKQNPEKTFVAASDKAECQYMKMITLQKVFDSLSEDKYEVKVPKQTADKARLAIERMLAIS
ncbi:MAG: quinolinate synthase NadA [Crenarchaeota archaeon]|nr:MAG: quinolinate synthase NadA [Thermoproteota archaeon]RDJ32932.1 MAG: quinolinate synthase NadA [Thermoproteota archaeon]RDJ35986.1 MAG: quinolinate synthase NadA [Thermoproteota archaeon]RDJ38233.1 MAG: quinolinate synthase NadA [Thermoproteota archaeon]